MPHPYLCKLSAHDVRAVAVRAARDPRTVIAVIEGRPTTSTSRAAVERAARELGLDRHHSEPPPGAAA